ncbi:hypothetical protein GY45DRAFT_725809 [Cubamyces sp. BRFM 1775]|nr:hypothetical protein GY45DRAFT_725809 [Cubamyces sp. BRFM 1775]
MTAVPTDPYDYIQWNMKLAHRTFEEGYNVIVSKLDDPPMDDLRNFLGYCEAWTQSVIDHHDTEEATLFPALNAKMDFSHEKEQHAAVHTFLEDFLATVRTAQADTSKFDAVKLKSMLESSNDAIFSHFREEVEHLEPAKLKAAGFTPAECQQMTDDVNKYAKSHGDPFLAVPYMRSHTAPEYKDVWPPIPWILRKLVVPYVLAKKHSGHVSSHFAYNHYGY